MTENNRPTPGQWATVSTDDGWTVDVISQPTGSPMPWQWRVGRGPLRTVMAGVFDPGTADPILALATVGVSLFDYDTVPSPQRLDSPFAGLDPKVSRQLWRAVNRIKPGNWVTSATVRLRLTEVDQDGRGPNEWLAAMITTAGPNESHEYLASTSDPTGLAVRFSQAGIPVEWRYVDVEPTCDHCGLGQYATEADGFMWNGDTGCHTACEEAPTPTAEGLLDTLADILYPLDRDRNHDWSADEIEAVAEVLDVYRPTARVRQPLGGES